MFDIVSIGELLIDFTPVDAGGTRGFQQNAGGAPANVAVAARQLGKRTAFIGKVGNDAFGRFLRETLSERDVDVRGIRLTDDFPTTLAFVHLDSAGERYFSFYRNPSADIMLDIADVDLDLLKKTRVLHFGSVSMTADPSRTATLESVRIAKEHGAVISFDPNLRASLWSSLEEAKEKILLGAALADVLKISEEELEFLTGQADLAAGVAQVRKGGSPTVVLVTMGSRGCYYSAPCGTGLVASFPVKAVDTTGAGDGFTGAFLAEWIAVGKPLSNLSQSELLRIVQTANACGALTTTKRGGIPALPTYHAVKDLIAAPQQL